MNASCRKAMGLVAVTLSCFSPEMIAQSPVSVTVPLSIDIDQDPVATKACVSLQIYKILKEWDQFAEDSSSPEDKVLAGLLKCVYSQDQGTITQYISSQSISDVKIAVQSLNRSYFPPAGKLRVLGRITVYNGAAYLLNRIANNYSDFPILSVSVSNNGKLNVEGVNHVPMLDVISDSLAGKTEGQFWQGVTQGDKRDSFDLDGFVRSNLIVDSSVVTRIYQCLHVIKDSSGAKGFTDASQQIVDESMRMLKSDGGEARTKWVNDYDSDAKRISYVLSLYPIYITIQKAGGNNSAYYYYKRNGEFYNANVSFSGPFDQVLRSLPEPSQDVIDRTAKIIANVASQIK